MYETSMSREIPAYTNAYKLSECIQPYLHGDARLNGNEQPNTCTVWVFCGDSAGLWATHFLRKTSARLRHTETRKGIAREQAIFEHGGRRVYALLG